MTGVDRGRFGAALGLVGEIGRRARTGRGWLSKLHALEDPN